MYTGLNNLGLNGRSGLGAPSLNLNFLNGTTDSRITYSGGANGTRVNSAGLVVAAVAPRYDYNPVTLTPLGLLVEEARTNLAVRSAEFDNVSWVKLGTATVTPNTNIAPDGTLSADTLNMPASGDRINLAAIGVTGGSTVTATLWLSGSGTTYIALSSSGGTFKFNGTLVTLTATLTRYQVTLVTNADNTGVFPVIGRYNGAVGAGTATAAVIWGYQFEVGSFPTSYIPTTSASVTRSVDSAVMTGTNFSSWYNQTQGTFVVNAISAPGLGSVAQASLEVDDGTTNVRQVLFKNGSGLSNAQVSNSGTQADLVGDAWAASTLGKMAFAYAPNDFAMSFNAATCITDVSGTVPTVTQMVIGDTAAVNRAFNGRIQSIRYYPQRLGNTVLQSLTT